VALWPRPLGVCSKPKLYYTQNLEVRHGQQDCAHPRAER
jgi:hypothetical protein